MTNYSDVMREVHGSQVAIYSWLPNLVAHISSGGDTLSLISAVAFVLNYLYD